MDARGREQATEDPALAVAAATEQVWASRAVIERATGVLMERYGLDSDRAKETLLQASHRTNTPMRKLAEDVLASDRTDEPLPIRDVLETTFTPEALHRAVAFIESEAARPIRLTDIAAAAGIGSRALQYDFARHYNTTPMRYLRSVRLERAHRDLQKADPQSGDTIASIAARWGFFSPGRFAMQYRSVYGRSPHHTWGKTEEVRSGH